jgi:type VI protein secretion system component Hcp
MHLHRRVEAAGRGPNPDEEEAAMAKKAGTERKKKIKDLKVKDVQAAEAQAVTGGKTSFSDFQFTHKYDKSSPVLAS